MEIHAMAEKGCKGWRQQVRALEHAARLEISGIRRCGKAKRRLEPGAITERGGQSSAPIAGLLGFVRIAGQPNLKRQGLAQRHAGKQPARIIESRMRSGTGLRQLTSTVDANPYETTAAWVAISGDGAKIAFESTANLAVMNPDKQPEIFVIDWAGTGLRQLTNSTQPPAFPVESRYPAITDDAQFVYFTSNQSTTTVNPDGSYEIWKIKTDGTGKTLITNTAFGKVAAKPCQKTLTDAMVLARQAPLAHTRFNMLPVFCPELARNIHRFRDIYL